MKIKHLLALYVLTISIATIGSLFKIMSWPFASELLIIGMLSQAIILLLLVIKLLRFKDPDSILNK